MKRTILKTDQNNPKVKEYIHHMEEGKKMMFLIKALIHEFENSKHRVVVAKEGDVLVLSTNYKSLVIEAVRKVWDVIKL